METKLEIFDEKDLEEKVKALQSVGEISFEEQAYIEKLFFEIKNIENQAIVAWKRLLDILDQMAKEKSGAKQEKATEKKVETMKQQVEEPEQQVEETQASEEVVENNSDAEVVDLEQENKPKKKMSFKIRKTVEE